MGEGAGTCSTGVVVVVGVAVVVVVVVVVGAALDDQTGVWGEPQGVDVPRILGQCGGQRGVSSAAGVVF